MTATETLEAKTEPQKHVSTEEESINRFIGLYWRGCYRRLLDVLIMFGAICFILMKLYGLLSHIMHVLCLVMCVIACFQDDCTHMIIVTETCLAGTVRLCCGRLVPKSFVVLFVSIREQMYSFCVVEKELLCDESHIKDIL